MNKKIFLGFVVAVLAFAPVLGYAATFRTGDSYYLDPGSSIDDNLYVAGGNISIAGAVNGDLFSAGGNMTVAGPVSGDFVGAGGSLNINSNIAGDARIVGGNIVIMNSIGGELVAAGGQISVTKGVLIGKDANIAGGSIDFAGETGRGMTVKGDRVYINGTVGGNLSVEAKEIKLGPNAVIKGNFNYSSPAEAVVDQGALVSGTVDFKKINIPAKGVAEKKLGFGFGFLSIAWAIKSLMILVAALVLLYFFSAQTKTIVHDSVSGFWKKALLGFVVLVVVPIAIILSFITVIGVFVGLVALLAYIALVIISSFFAVLIFAQLALKYVFKKENYKLNWWIAILAVLVFGLISIIPFVGWIFTFIIFLSALGSTANFVYNKFKG